jgi:hypothetical protein
MIVPSDGQRRRGCQQLDLHRIFIGKKKKTIVKNCLGASWVGNFVYFDPWER